MTENESGFVNFDSDHVDRGNVTLNVNYRGHRLAPPQMTWKEAAKEAFKGSTSASVIRDKLLDNGDVGDFFVYVMA